jgi:hypothetical protein
MLRECNAGWSKKVKPTTTRHEYDFYTTTTENNSDRGENEVGKSAESGARSRDIPDAANIKHAVNRQQPLDRQM